MKPFLEVLLEESFLLACVLVSNFRAVEVKSPVNEALNEEELEEEILEEEKQEPEHASHESVKEETALEEADSNWETHFSGDQPIWMAEMEANIRDSRSVFPLESLIGAFTLNEKLQFINELFDGSSDDF